MIARIASVVGLLLLCVGLTTAAEPTAKSDMPGAKATFAGGCFWCMEEAFEPIPGVLSAVSGYIGGEKKNPTYEEVSDGFTGHAEVIQITYDPAKISYEKLLDAYWANVDPYDSLGQFCDKGDQYRAEIFYHDENQKRLAEASKSEISKKLTQNVVRISAASEFYPAEEYHQDYYKKNPLSYAYYKYRCGREVRLKEVWGKDKAAAK